LRYGNWAKKKSFASRALSSESKEKATCKGNYTRNNAWRGDRYKESEPRYRVKRALPGSEHHGGKNIGGGGEKNPPGAKVQTKEDPCQGTVDDGDDWGNHLPPFQKPIPRERRTAN